jgi:DNA-binding NarL/FixJ family response regulator
VATRPTTTTRLDPHAVDAVLRTAGHPVARRPAGPTGLTVREIEVLRLLARWLSNKDISSRLLITTKTTRHHVEHIYTKIGVSSRVGASLYAMQLGLLDDELS